MSERGFFSKILLRASKQIYKDQTDLNVVFLRNVLSLIEGGDLSKNRKIMCRGFPSLQDVTNAWMRDLKQDEEPMT